MALSIPLGELDQIAQQHGLLLMGISTLTDLSAERAHLESWQAEGLAGEMDYMRRSADLLCQPRQLLESTRSIISFALPYSSEPAPSLCPPGFGRVARYAWGRDYHRVIKKVLGNLLETLKKHLGPALQYRHFTDAVPLLERALAKNAGLGFIGKNTMLIRPKTGSLFFLAEVLWNVDIIEPAQNSRLAIATDCGSCERCISACPTGAFLEPFKLDARKCISYLSIEKRGILKADEGAALGNWLFGCDICQEVCPFNHTSLKEGRLPELEDFRARGLIRNGLLELNRVFSIASDSDFLKLFAGTPLMRTGRSGLLRNAACVAANSMYLEAVPHLLRLASEDPSNIVRLQSLAALSRLSENCDKQVKLNIEKVLQLNQYNSAERSDYEKLPELN